MPTICFSWNTLDLLLLMLLFVAGMASSSKKWDIFRYNKNMIQTTSYKAEQLDNDDDGYTTSTEHNESEAEDGALENKHDEESLMALTFGKKLLDMKVIHDIRLRMYLCKARMFCGTAVEDWSFNRKVDMNHVQHIHDELLKMKIPHLLGTIKVVYGLQDQKYRVIDGQHRLTAITQITEKNISWDINIVVEVFDVKDVTCSDVFELYHMANKNLNIALEDNPLEQRNKFISDIVRLVQQHPELRLGIVDSMIVYAPKLSARTLYESLKTFCPSEIPSQLTPETIVQRIVSENRRIGSGVIHDSELFKYPSSNMTTEQKTNILKRINTQKTKASKIKFYLNMSQSRIPPKVWLKKIFSE